MAVAHAVEGPEEAGNETAAPANRMARPFERRPDVLDVLVSG